MWHNCSMKRALFAGLFLVTIVLLAVGIYFYRQQWEWLNTRRLDGLSMYLLASFGLAVVITPIILRRRPRNITTAELGRSYLRIFILVFGIFAGIFMLLAFFGFVIELMGRYPLVIVPLLLLLIPFGLITIDMFQGKVMKSSRNLIVGYSYYSFAALYLLLAQFLLIPILFFLGPMGIFLIFISIVDVVARIVPSLEAAPIQPLCYWTGIGHPFCVPALLLLALLYLILAFIAVRFGSSIMDALADGYRKGKEKLGNEIQKDVDT